MAAMSFARAILVACGLVLLGGCATRTVQVIDDTRAPIRGATVKISAPSIGLLPRTTSGSGKVTVPWAVQKYDTVEVSKEGYVTSPPTPLGSAGVTVVVLHPAKK